MTEKELEEQTIQAFREWRERGGQVDLQLLWPNGWVDTTNPVWCVGDNYRVKPQPLEIFDRGYDFVPEEGDVYYSIGGGILSWGVCNRSGLNAHINSLAVGQVFRTQKGADMAREKRKAEVKLKSIAAEHYSDTSKLAWVLGTYNFAQIKGLHIPVESTVFYCDEAPDIKSLGWTSEDHEALMWGGYVKMEELK